MENDQFHITGIAPLGVKVMIKEKIHFTKKRLNALPLPEKGKDFMSMMPKKTVC